MKKKLFKSMGSPKMTIEAYMDCLCQCGNPDCNPCGSVPTNAYIAQLDKRRNSALTTAMNSLAWK